jgi:hypothetical protein
MDLEYLGQVKGRDLVTIQKNHRSFHRPLDLDHYLPLIPAPMGF